MTLRYTMSSAGRRASIYAELVPCQINTIFTVELDLGASVLAFLHDKLNLGAYRNYDVDVGKFMEQRYLCMVWRDHARRCEVFGGALLV
jgi:hypothetical protein